MKPAEKSGRRKLWIFRLAAILLPLILFLCLELILRIADAGYPTSFFLTKKVNGETWLVENQKVTWRYFPPAIARLPETQAISRKKPEGSLRVIVLGESAALGDPEPRYGFARYFEVLLEDQLKRDVEIINGSIVAINSHVLLPIARELASLEPDLWLIYMGNNEVIGPFGSGTVFGLQSPPLPIVRAIIFAKKFRTFQLLELGLNKLFNKEPQTWGGMEMFLKQQVRHDDPRLKRLYSHFQNNLQDILKTAAKTKAPVLLATVASNLRDCAPFGSMNSPNLANKAEWNKLFEAGLAETNSELALKHFASARALDPSYAELTYRIGKLASSPELLTLARDQDTLRFRTDSKLNVIIRSAAKIPNTTLVDTVAEFGIPGRKQFLEHVHFTFSGNYDLAKMFGRETLKALNKAPGEWLAFTNASAKLGLNPVAAKEVLTEVKVRLQQPPFTSQAFHNEDLAWINRSIEALHPNLEEALKTVKLAVASRPTDWQVKEAYGELLLKANHLAEAEKQFEEVLQIVPHRAQARFLVGTLREKQNDMAGAHAAFDQAIASTHSIPEAWTSKGLLYEKEGQHDRAIEAYKQAIEDNPAFAAAHQNLGMLLAQLGRNEEALQSIETAIRLRPDNATLYTSKAALLDKTGQPVKAAEVLNAALKTNPHSVQIRQALASRFLAAKQPERAVPLFQQILGLEPGHFPTLMNMGVIHAQRREFEKALPYFQKAAEVHPNALDARINLGVCYARLNRPVEARREFNQVLQQDPENPQAKQFLERLR